MSLVREVLVTFLQQQEVLEFLVDDGSQLQVAGVLQLLSRLRRFFLVNLRQNQQVLEVVICPLLLIFLLKPFKVF
jgi:hypothetical protein